ncbi:MAG TPA: polysaccharide deacetylase family protein [Solirubrobacteraceae bacterium]|nr:polysaccharide deacetylase family protein [Solirubrobacteraceae bacterium]
MSIVIPVLLYHSVSDQPPADGAWGAVSCAAFASHVKAIRASGREALEITTLAAALRGEHPLPERPVAVTFDDGYADTYPAVEWLRDHGIGSTVYVTTGRIGAPGRMSAQQVADLARLPGVEVGAHGVGHKRLDELPQDELLRELADSRAHLEQLTGEGIDSFAYPHGAHNRCVRAAVITQGFRSAAAVKNALCHSDDDPFALARVTVTATTSAGRIAQVLDGVGVPLGRSRERLRTRAYRTARRHRRRLLQARGMLA